MMTNHQAISSEDAGNLNKFIAISIVFIAFPICIWIWRKIQFGLNAPEKVKSKIPKRAEVRHVIESKVSSDYMSVLDANNPSITLSSFADQINRSFRLVNDICEIVFADNSASKGGIRIEYSFNEEMNILFAPELVVTSVHDYSEEPIPRFTLNSKNKISAIAKEGFGDVRIGSEKKLLSHAKGMLELFSPGLYLISLRKPNPKDIQAISHYYRNSNSGRFYADGTISEPSYVFASHVNKSSEEIQTFVDLIRNGARPIVVALNNLQICNNNIYLSIGESMSDYLSLHDAYILEGHSILLAYIQLGITPNILLFSKYFRMEDCNSLLLPKCIDFLEDDQVEIVIRNTMKYFPSADLKFTDYSLAIDKYLQTANYIPARLFLAIIEARKNADNDWLCGKMSAIKMRLHEIGNIKIGIPKINDPLSCKACQISSMLELEKELNSFDDVADVHIMNELSYCFRTEKIH